jgi:prepilin-type N-terminal cleavage/methylation domain-containing protein
MLGLKRQGQRGDTIVEVMIVLAVLGSAIGISYATANRSLLNARQAQESSRATVIAQAQVEQLRALASIKNNLDIARFTDAITFPDACKYDKTTGFEYDVSIKYDNTLGDDKFTVRVLYDDVLGQGQDSVTLTYRVHVAT